MNKKIVALVVLIIIFLVAILLYCNNEARRKNALINQLYINYYNEFCKMEKVREDNEKLYDTKAVIICLERADAYADLIEFSKFDNTLKNISQLILAEMEKIDSKKLIDNSVEKERYKLLMDKIKEVREEMEEDIIGTDGSFLSVNEKMDKDKWLKIYSNLRLEIDTSQKHEQ